MPNDKHSNLNADGDDDDSFNERPFKSKLAPSKVTNPFLEDDSDEDFIGG